MSSACAPKALVLRPNYRTPARPIGSSSKNTPLSGQPKEQVHFRLWHLSDLTGLPDDVCS